MKINKTLIVLTENLSNDVCGQIRVTHDNIIEIEIDMKKYTSNENRDALLGMLSHEIIHQYLYEHNLKFGLTFENEVFTDISAVYNGLGKLMLNGSINIRHELIYYILLYFSKFLLKKIIDSI